MRVYWLVIVGLLVITACNEFSGNVISNKPRKISMITMVTLLALVAGLRYKVGADYWSYYSSYDYFKTAELSIFDEPAIKIIARVAARIYDDPATMLFLAAAITVCVMATTVIKNSEMYWFSILLYVFLGCWHGCFNGVRQYLAAAVLFAGHHFIKEQKFPKWCLVVFVAAMCHITAVIGLLFYFYPKIRTSVVSVVSSLAVAFVAMGMYDKIFDFIGFLKSDTFVLEGAGSEYLTNSINPLRIAVAWVPVIFFLVFRRYYNRESEKFQFYMSMTILHAILMTTAMNSAYLGRVGIYTGVFNTITWPLLLKKVDDRSKKIMIVMMLAFYILYWRTEASGPNLINFQWIFQR